MTDRATGEVGGAEIARAIAQQDPHAAWLGMRCFYAVVSNSEVLFAIAIKIAHRY